MTRHTLLALAVLVPAIVFAGGAPAAAGDINFENISGMTPMSPFFDGTLVPQDEPLRPSSRLSTQLRLSAGVTFSSDAGYVALVNLGGGHATSGVAGIGGAMHPADGGPDILKYSAPIVITFTVPGDPTTPAVYSFVSIRGDNFPNPSGLGFATMEALDINGNPVTNLKPDNVNPVTKPDAAGFTLSIETLTPTIHSVRITQTLSDIAFDDLRVNNAPVVDAGPDQAVFVGDKVMLNGSGTRDPDRNDVLRFSWTLTTPVGSAAVLTEATTEFPTFVTDVPGEYIAILTVTDDFGGIATDDVIVTADIGANFVPRLLMQALNLIGDLKSEQVTSRGNQKALQQFLGQALSALRNGDTDRARDKIMKSIDRTDGCTLREAPDHDGDDRRDWITDCPAQRGIYELLTTALGAL
jgi:K319-like protein